MHQEAVLLAGGTLGGRRHVCAFFHTRDEEYRTLLPFVIEGFERGEKAIHIVDPALRADHLARLGAAGIDVGAAEARKQLEVSDWTETYLPDGTFDRRVTSARVKALFNRTRAEGFPRARIIGHAEWSLQNPAHTSAIVEYESRMNDVLPQYDDPVVCTYDRSRFGGGTLMDVLRAHPVVILDGALSENPFYLPPSRLLFRLRASAISVLLDRFLVALLAGARREALDIVIEEGVWEDVPVTSLHTEVVQAALYEVGRLWRQRKITVTQEHAATEIARLALAQLRPLLPCAPSNGKHIVFACVEGELHDLGARMTADFLEMAGFEVQYLGANVPTASLVELVRQRPPALLALSATAPASVPTLRRAVTAIRGVAGRRVPLLLGGQVLLRRPELPKRLGVRFHARDAHEAVALARRLLESDPQRP